MAELINGKMPDEIKNTLKFCGAGNCDALRCPYTSVRDCSESTMRDAFALITRLEEEVAKRDKLLAVLGVRIPEDGGADDDE